MKSRILKFKNPKEVVVDTNKSEEKYVLVEVNVRDRDVKLPIFLSVGEGARIVCVVIVSITGTGSVLLNSKQIHNAQEGYSDFLCKTVVKDGKFSYNGVIEITKKGNHSHAYQRNENLVIGEGGVVTSEPLLEIQAHEVFCTHGATISAPSEDELYYLMTRGLSFQKSEDLIVDGFLKSGIEKLTTNY
ncbi:MAG: SufD family Fe-S cluster assembly protein [Patescibacteria group bacterium]